MSKFRKKILSLPFCSFLEGEKRGQNGLYGKRVRVKCWGYPIGGWGAPPPEWQVTDPYHPINGEFTCLSVKIPKEAVSVFPEKESKKWVITDQQGRQCINFVIHPMTYNFYEQEIPGFDKMEKEKVPVFATSSYRTLVIKGDGKIPPTMVKVSTPGHPGQVEKTRMVTVREAKLSIANWKILKARLKTIEVPMDFVEDDVAVIPKGKQGLLDAAMIRRSGSIIFEAEQKGYSVFPLLALFGVQNHDLLRERVAKSGLTVTNYLIRRILEPIAETFFKLLIEGNIALEIHGQNLVMIGDKLAYRDAGGMNILPYERDFMEVLPEDLRDRGVFYKHDHVENAKWDIEEFFVFRVLFALTKSLVKNPEWRDTDPQFKRWYDQMEREGKLGNWTTGNDNDNDHQAEIPEEKFVRYGYVETLFADVCLTVLINLKQFNLTEIGTIKSTFDQSCGSWFEGLISQFYKPSHQ